MSQSSSRRVCLVSAVVVLSLAFGFMAWSPAGRGVPSLPAAMAAPANSTAFIVSSYPEDGAVNVSLGSPIVVAFSEPMNTSMVSWTITPAILLVPTWDLTDTILTLAHPAAFAACTLYTVGFPGLAPGPVPNPWSFLTTCPGSVVVVATDPANGAVNVSLNATVTVWFSGPMDPASVTVTLTPAITLVPAWDPARTTLTLSHPWPFAACTRYTLIVDGRDSAGRPLAPGPYTLGFTTACPPPNPVTVVNLPPGGTVNARLVVATEP